MGPVKLSADAKVLRQDALLAAVVTVITLGVAVVEARLVAMDPAIELEMTPARFWALGTVACVQALFLALRRSRTSAMFVAVAACQLALVAIAPEVMAHGVALLVAAYTAGARLPMRVALSVAVPAVVAEALVVVVSGWELSNLLGTVTGQVASVAISYIGAIFAGSYVASRRRERELERMQARAEVAAQREHAATAIAAERNRIARELHDVAAHHLSGMIVQASAVDRLIGRDDDAARSGAAWIRSQGKATLENLRQVVGLLRDDNSADPNSPVPSLEVLPALVAEARQAGVDVVLEQTGGTRPLPPIADISCYRIVQQALTNVRQHAPGAATLVRLDHQPHVLRIDVVNGPATRAAADLAGGGGSGLIGMRERADLIGADLTAGPSDDGGWQVRLHLPLRDDDGNVGVGENRRMAHGGDTRPLARGDSQGLAQEDYHAVARNGDAATDVPHDETGEPT